MSLRVLALLKVPPIQGGVSTKSYWFARNLAAAGSAVHVVTNAAEVEPPFRIRGQAKPGTTETVNFDNGGSLRITYSGAEPRVAQSFIPTAQPFVTKLVSLGLRAAAAEPFDVVVGSYYEPYGFAAGILAQLLALPFVIDHAGSDRTRLLNHDELGPAYIETFRRANVVLSADGSLEGFGIPTSRIMRGGIQTFVSGPEWTGTTTEDFSALPTVFGDADTLDRDKPVVGIYGKPGEFKGSFDLVAALERLSTRVGFNFVALCGSSSPEFVDAVANSTFADRAVVFDFISPWRVPEFLRNCDVVCFLERDFPVEIHTPGIPREICIAGRPLLLSEEIRRKQFEPDRLVHGINCLVVNDPKDHDELASVLNEALTMARAKLTAIGDAARELFEQDDAAAHARASLEILERAVSPQSDDSVVSVEDVVRRLEYVAPRASGVLDRRVLDRLAASVLDEEPHTSELHACRRLLQLAISDSAALDLDVDATAACTFDESFLWCRIMDPAEWVAPAFGVPTVWYSPESVIRPEDTIVRRTLLRVLTFNGDPVDESRSAATSFVFRKRRDLYARVFRVGSGVARLLRTIETQPLSVADAATLAGISVASILSAVPHLIAEDVVRIAAPALS